MSSTLSRLPPCDLPTPLVTVAEYHRRIASGLLTENDNVELLEGRIVPKMPRNPPHDSSLLKLNRKLTRLLPDSDWDVRIQMAVTLADSEPEPDATVVRHTADDYARQHPGPVDIGMLAEVADSTLAFDRRDKARIYARANIPCYWIINLIDRQIEVYTHPDPHANPPCYRQRQDYTVSHSVPLVLDGQSVAEVPVSEVMV